MDLREYLEILRRRLSLIIVATVVVAVAAGLSSNMETRMYKASSSVLLRPNDAAEQLYPERSGGRPNDPDRNVAAQLDIVESEAVAVAAAKDLDLRARDAEDLLDKISATQRRTTDVIEIAARDEDPERAAEIANAFTSAYIENRRLFAVTGLERASGELEGKLAELDARIVDLNGRIAGLAPEAPAAGKAPIAAPVVNASEGALRAARDAATLQYETLYARQQELLVTKSLKRGEAEMIAEAQAPDAPMSPNPKRATTLGALVGLMLGLGVALLRDQLDDRLRGRDDVAQVTAIPVLAELPLEAESSRQPNAIATHERPLGALAESTRGLRTSLSFLNLESPLRLIVVTSSRPGEGKSTVASNLAAAYAQSGVKTVLVSADLRRPRLESIFAVEARFGLTQLLADRSTPPVLNGNGNGNGQYGTLEITPLQKAVSAAIVPTHIDNLFLLPAGQLPPNPAELLGSARASDVLDAVLAVADIVIIDTPPILAVTDAAILASRADGVMVVAGANQTHRKALAQSVGTLGASRARLLGVVLNKVTETGRSSYYGTYGDYLPVSETQGRKSGIKALLSGVSKVAGR